MKHGSASRVSARVFERLFGGQRVGSIDTLWRMPGTAQCRRAAKRVRGVGAKSSTRPDKSRPGRDKTQGSIQRAGR